ncbi:MAG: hypothetical protein ACXWQR_00610 [Ktedonobacterales bacterium]
MGYLSFFVVLGCVACALAASWAYYRRCQLSRVPLGVINLTDIVVMIVAIIVVPFLYLILPVWLVAAVLLLTAISVLYVTVQPLLRARWAVWLVALALILIDAIVAYRMGTQGNAFFVVNDVVMIVLVVGVANLWAQGGAKARDMVILGLFLALYDFIATARLPLMNTLIDRLSGLPLAPIIAWRSGNVTLSLGLGDLLMASVFPLVMRKGYGRTAGLVVLALPLVAISGLLVFPLRQEFPLMVILGPLMALQFLYWRRRQGLERTTRQYLLEELPAT